MERTPFENMPWWRRISPVGLFVIALGFFAYTHCVGLQTQTGVEEKPHAPAISSPDHERQERL